MCPRNSYPEVTVAINQIFYNFPVAGEGGDGGLDDLEIPLIIKKCVLLDNLSRNSNKITVDFYKLFIKVSKTMRALVVWSLFSQR